MIRIISSLKNPELWTGDPSDRRQIIAGCDLFTDLPPSSIEEMVAVARFRTVPRGAPIWLAGAHADFFSIVGQGIVKMCKATSKGREVTMEVFGPGECLGLIVVLEGRPFPLSAIALTDSCVLNIPADATKHVFTSQPSHAKRIVASIAPRITQAHEMLAIVVSASVEEKVAHVLCVLMDKFGRTGNKGGVRLTYPLTRQEIAELAGTTVETCIRVMSKWEKANLVVTDQHIVTVRDPVLLREIARGLCP